MATEIIEKRDLYTKHFDIGNNQIEAIIDSKPVHYLENGEYKDINTSIKDLSIWEFLFGVEENLYKSYFYDSVDTNNHLVSFEFYNEAGQARWVNYKLQNANPDFYSIENNKFTFLNCFGEMDVEYIVTEDKLKENIILSSKPSITEFLFTLKSDEVEFNINQAGELEFLDIDSGELLFLLDKPYMIDAEGTKNFGVEYSLIKNADSYDELYLTVTDTAFLDSAVYPIEIDPTTTLNYDTGWQDAYAWTAEENTVHNDERIKLVNGSYNTCYAFIHFDLPEDTARVIDAQFEMYSYQSGYAQYIQYIDLFEVLGAWDETTLTWNNQPDTNKFQAETDEDDWTNWDTLNAYWKLDITELTQKWANGEMANNGLMFHLVSTKYNRGYYNFYSSEASTVGVRPKVTLTYISKPALAILDSGGDYLSNESGEVLKYLDFGMMTAGQESIPQVVTIENLCDFDIGYFTVEVLQDTLKTGIELKVSVSDTPYIWEDTISLNGSLAPYETMEFYVKLISDIAVESGGEFNIKVNAKPI